MKGGSTRPFFSEDKLLKKEGLIMGRLCLADDTYRFSRLEDVMMRSCLRMDPFVVKNDHSHQFIKDPEMKVRLHTSLPPGPV